MKAEFNFSNAVRPTYKNQKRSPDQLLLFDFGGVLFHYVPEVRLREVAQRTTWTESELKDTLWTSGFSNDCDNGLYTATEMHSKFKRLLSWECDYNTFAELWALAFIPNDEVVSFALELKVSGYSIGLMTNNAEILKTHLLKTYPEVMENFDHLFFSYAAKSIKPHRGFFDYVVSETGQNARNHLLIDDFQTNVNAAKSYGFKAIHFTSVSQLKNEIQSV